MAKFISLRFVFIKNDGNHTHFIHRKTSEILETVIRLINTNENWSGVGVMNDEEAKFSKKIFFTCIVGFRIQKSEAELCTFSEIKIQISV
jgi:hypothetical protein